MTEATPTPTPEPTPAPTPAATPTAAKPKPVKRKFVLVRYGRMNSLSLFEHNEAQMPRTPTRLVVKTDKGLELGHLVGQLSAYKDGRFRLSEDQISSYYVNSEITFSTECVGKVVRLATPDDISEEQHLQKITQEEIACCEHLARNLNLRMKIIDAEHIFGGERIVFYFMAEGRVDFRELVRKLAHEFQTRIEMRQIGVARRGQAAGRRGKLRAGCCCIQYLQLLSPSTCGWPSCKRPRSTRPRSPALRPAQVLPALRGRELHAPETEPAQKRRPGPDQARRGEGL